MGEMAFSGPAMEDTELEDEKGNSGGRGESWSNGEGMAEREARRVSVRFVSGPNSSCFRTSRKRQSASVRVDRFSERSWRSLLRRTGCDRSSPLPLRSVELVARTNIKRSPDRNEPAYSDVSTLP